MQVLEIFFWICVAVLFYSYAGYGLLLYILNKCRNYSRNQQPRTVSELPAVTFIIAAWNEAHLLEKKLKNTLSLEYPAEKLTVICITDGSDDDSSRVVMQYPGIIHMHMPERRGKIAAMNRAMNGVTTPITVFSDANALLNEAALLKMVVHFENEQVGGVAGEKIVSSNAGTPVGRSESLYWRYESFMKKMDADFHSVVGAAGELYAMRTGLWQPVAEHLILDDFIITMQVRMQGYKFAYEPGAFAQEAPSASFNEERKRKIRIAAGAFQSMYYLKASAGFKKSPALRFQYYSRRILRWAICPVLLPLCLFTNMMLVWHNAPAYYSVFLILQGIFYMLALSGLLFIKSDRMPGCISLPFYFVFMNSCMLEGSLVYFNGAHTVLWEKAQRESLA